MKRRIVCLASRRKRATTLKRATDAERFWTEVEIAAAGDGCWLWRGATNRQGYGVFFVGSRLTADRRTVLAHRYADELMNGPLPAGVVLLHACDTPGCVRHTRRGTQLENVRDMFAKGRGVLPPGTRRRAETVAAQERARERFRFLKALAKQSA